MYTPRALFSCLLPQICRFIVSLNIIMSARYLPLRNNIRAISHALTVITLHCPTANYSRYTYIQCIGYCAVEIWPFDFFQNGWQPHPGFDPTGNSAVRSAVPENLTLEPNMKSTRWRIVELWPFEIFPNVWVALRLIVGRQSSIFMLLNWSHILLFRYVRNVARSVRRIKTNKCVR